MGAGASSKRRKKGLSDKVNGSNEHKIVKAPPAPSRLRTRLTSRHLNAMSLEDNLSICSYVPNEALKTCIQQQGPPIEPIVDDFKAVVCMADIRYLLFNVYTFFLMIGYLTNLVGSLH